MAKYQGRSVKLNKPFRQPSGSSKKFGVYVRNKSTGRIKKVGFGDPNMKIKKNIPARQKSFLARMGNMTGPDRDSKGKPTRLLLSLRAWGASSKADARAKARAISKRNKAKA